MQNRAVFFKSLCVAFAIVLFMNGCSSQPKSVQKVQSSVPSWFLNPPSDNNAYMYGVAMGKDRDDAVKAALADMVSKLSIDLKSSYSSDQSVNDYYTKQKITNKIQTEVASIKINNYDIMQAKLVGYDRYAVLIRTDKRKFVNGLIDTLASEKSTIDLEYSLLKNKDSIARYNSLKKMSLQVKKIKHTLSIINELKSSISPDKKFNQLIYIADIVKIQQHFEDQKNRLNFYIAADKKASVFVDAVKNFLASKGLNVSNATDKNSVIINMKSDHLIYKSSYFDIAVIHLNLQIVSNSMLVGGRAFTFKERYAGSMPKAYQGAVLDLHKELGTHTLNDAIGLNLQ
jgi:hypothetical protein